MKSKTFENSNNNTGNKSKSHSSFFISPSIKNCTTKLFSLKPRNTTFSISGTINASSFSETLKLFTPFKTSFSKTIFFLVNQH